MVVWLIFIITAFSSIFVGLNRGLIKTGISFIGKIINFIISFVISRILVNSLSEEIGRKILTYVKKEYGVSLLEVSSIEEFLRFITSIVIGVIAFYIIYCIGSIIITIIKHVLLYNNVDDRKLKLDPTVNKVITVLTSLVSTSLTFMILVTPIGIIYNSVSDNFPVLTGSKLPFVSEIYFNKLTEMPDNKNDVQATKEFKYTVDLIIASSKIYTIGNNENDVEKFQESFEKSYFLPTVIGEFGSSAAKQWKSGNDYFGIEFEIPEGREGKLVIDFLNILEKWNKKTVVEDVNTIINILTIINEYGPNMFKDENGFLNALADEEFTEELFVVLYNNDDFAQLVPSVIEYGLGTAFDYMNIDVDEDYIASMDITNNKEEDVRRQARLVSETIRTILAIQETAQKIDNNQLNQADIENIINDLNELKDDELLKDVANELINQLNANIVNIEF